MPRLVATTIAFIRQFARASRGATAVEFALISIPLMLLMFGILELGLILLVTATLDTATDFAARNVRTGEFQENTGGTKDDFAKLVCRNMSWLKDDCIGSMIVESETFSTFANAGSAPPANPQSPNPTTNCWSVGNPEDIVLVRTYFKWPIFTPLMQPFLANDGAHSRLLSSARIFRNEPFNATLQPVGAKCT
ncbi:MAG: TadE/TadG family type IV pilus assembly protein [Pseudomonadota bacterium]|mgnify:FL=1|uniref:TadE/TadG family type IV pilus assembly protein n=1 Tax=unclassified Phenylobacterium TaxID=2640670 RepID=UPI0006FE3770|nr:MULTISPECIES: TadE/TadG family type IV pilus assembly protein [unclassified Phenylobacterium]KRB40513.1 hypothetical protein ASE02_07370 [Phenylobacterium sp. Root700]MBT9473293.1 pilus assembly protein [Phenylobacterium sp.]